MDATTTIRFYLVRKKAALTWRYGSWPQAKQAIRSSDRSQLVQEFASDISTVWRQVCGALHVLQQDQILSLVVEGFDLSFPQEAEFAQVATDALLIACGLPAGWWSRNGKRAVIITGLGAVLVAAIFALRKSGGRAA
ncbi:MAG: hypothetical protein ACYCOR_15520 [Acidobacteriaceae bacterium]